MPDQPWINKISTAAQIGGIETSVLDTGAGKGTRIAWINTGTGLRYKVVLDRAMDIMDTFFNQHSLAWLSNVGITYPQPFSNRGVDWLKTFGGGLLTTCGLSHIGGPETDEHGERGLHGEISNIPAEIESIIQPDPASGKLKFSITGKMKQAQVLLSHLELRRTISGELGKSSIHIHDDVTNKGNVPEAHMLLYHCNFGWPLIDDGTDILWNGKWFPRFNNGNQKIFVEGNNFRKCPPPLDIHNGTGEEVALIDIDSDEAGQCVCGLHNSSLNLAVTLRFSKEQFPWLINWQHWGKGEYVTGLEPSTNNLDGQSQARKNKQLILLQPGETRAYDLQIDVVHDKQSIEKLLQEIKPH
ncbi:MAG: aldose 1-epimerase family protein [Chitinophagaceae bacterium]